MNFNVLLAVFKRNFTAYFVSPLGYVFICLFVLMSSMAAFWPNEFFSRNLANLDQVNQVFPFIMLFFVPAITMSLWADERRQGTDELLLTIPAGDLDIVLGKYLAGVAIYTVCLFFSACCDATVLAWLGNPDLGLLFGTYVGYWLVGLAMLAVGMVGSFLTGSLTLAFVFGAVLNVPLVFAALADRIQGREVALMIQQWSIGEQFRDFGRGILSLGGLVYFGTITAVALYFNMVLIGRRHWAKESSVPVLGVVGLLFALFLAGIAGLMLTGIQESGTPLAVFIILWTVIGLGLAMALGLVVLWLVQSLQRNASLLPLHYAVRTLSLIAVAAGLTYALRHHDLRLDASSGKLSSLAPQTVDLLKELNGREDARTVKVEAFISPEVPEAYVQTRLNLVTMLQELKSAGNVDLVINPTEPNSEEAMRADKRYGITPREVRSTARGAYTEEPIFMGVAFTSGLQKVVLPFIDRGIPVEHELVRSLLTVTQQKRKRVGVLQTDAQLYGSFNMQTMGRSSNWPIIDELQKGYDVVQVDATQPITEKYDVLLAVQPSSLGPEQMQNFIAAVKAGQPTAIFEDPLAYFTGGSVPGTSEPRRPPGGMNPMMMGQQNMPKGDIRELWRLLGVDFSADNIVYQDYNPFPKLADLNKRYPEFVFVTRSAAPHAFNDENTITKGLQHVFFPFPGSITKLNASTMDFKPLVRTGTETGTVRFRDIYEMPPMFGRGDVNPNRRKHPSGLEYILAAQISGKVPADAAADPKDPAKKDEAKKEGQVNVVLVSDVDLLHGLIFRIREQGDIPEQGLYFDFDNVAFVLNILDKLAGDERFIEIRGRRPAHRTLTRVDRVTEASRKKTADEISKQQEKLEKARDDEEKALNEKIEEAKKELEKQNVNVTTIAEQLAIAQAAGRKRIETKVEQVQQEAKQKINQIETEQNVLIRKVQDRYKMWAVLLPPIPWACLAVVVFLIRRSGEREGVSRNRLKSAPWTGGATRTDGATWPGGAMAGGELAMENMTIGRALFSFEGRLCRSDYWLKGFLPLLPFGILNNILVYAVATEWAIALAFVIGLISFWPGLALIVKRLHDRDMSGWFALIILVPIVGPLFLIVNVWFMKGTDGPNRFGPDPLQPR